MEYITLTQRQLKELTDQAIDSIQEFTIMDIGMMKICLVSLGILFGISFTTFFKKISPFVKVAFLLSYIYILWRVFAEED